MGIPRQPFSRSEILLIAILAFVQFTHIVDFMIMMPLGPQLMRAMNIGPKEFSVLVSSYTFMAAFSGLACSFFIDRFDRKKALFTLYVGFALGTIACGVAQGYGWLLFCRTLTGGFGGVLGSLILAVVGDAFPAERRGTATGAVMMSFSMASIFGVPLSLFLANIWAWHAPFLFVGSASLIALGFVWMWMPPMAAHIHGKRRMDLRKVLFNRDRVLGLLLMMALILGQFSIVPFLSPYLVMNVGLKESQLPLIYLFGGAITMFTSPFVGRMSDRKGPATMVTYAAIASIFPFLFVTHLAHASVPLIIFTTMALFVVMGGRMVPALTLVQGQVDPANRGSYMGLVSCVQQFSSALAAFIAGHVVTKNANGQLENFGIIGWWACILSLIAIVIVRVLHGRIQRAAPVTLAA